jgi:hypothetical protein
MKGVFEVFFNASLNVISVLSICQGPVPFGLFYSKLHIIITAINIFVNYNLCIIFQAGQKTAGGAMVMAGADWGS